MTAAPKPIRSIEGISEYQLENGLKVLLLPDATQPTVTVNLVYAVGSRHEGRGEAGMAHLLEHMLFKGTPKTPNVKGALQDKGCIFNATTWLDRTNYYETLPASEENLRFCLELEADRMINSNIHQKDLDAEMTVVRNEFEMGENDPFHVLHDQMMSAAYRWHNYGKSTIGNRSDIERVPATTLKVFYKKYYQPDNATLIVAGQFKASDALSLIGEVFGPIPRPSRVLEDTYTEEPAQDGPRLVTLQRVGDVAFVGAGYHICSGRHKDMAAIRVLCEILGSEPSGIFYKRLVEPGLSTEVSAMPYSLSEPGMCLFFGKPTKIEEAKKLLGRLQEIVEELDWSAVTDKSVQRAKNHLLKHIKLAQHSSKDFALRLCESVAQGDFSLYFWIRDEISAVTLKDVKNVWEKYFMESNRTAGIFIPCANPKRAAVPETPTTDAIIERYKGNSTESVDEEFEATLQNIEDTVTRKEISQGINAAFLPKPARLKAASVRFIFRIGDENHLAKQQINMRLLGEMLMRGTKTKSHEDIQDFLDEHQTILSLYSARGAIVASLTSDHENISAGIELVADLLKNSKLSASEFNLVKNKELSDLEESQSDPQNLAMTWVSRAKNPYPSDSVHYVATIEEQIEWTKGAKLENVANLYAQLLGAQHLDFSSLGAIDEKVITDLVQKEFSDWQAPVAYKRIYRPFIKNTHKNKVIKTPDKEMAFITKGTNLRLSDQDPEYPAMRLASYIFGESMKSRMMLRIREKEGLAYGCGSFLECESMDSAGSFTLYSMCSPKEANKTLGIMEEELNAMIHDGLRQKELDEAYLSFESHFNNMLANDGYLLKTLSSNLEIERTGSYYQTLLENMKSLTQNEINEVIKNQLGETHWATVTAGDL